MKRHNFFYLIVILVVWRLYLFFIAWLGSQFIPFKPSFPYSDIFFLPSGLPAWLWSFGNFDGVHYLTIAKQGYSAQFTQVFFPLYPLIIGFFSKVFPFISPVILGLFISNLFFLLALFLFYELLRIDYKEEQVKWIMLFLVIFPTSFFFGSIYTESLFLFLSISSFYLARKKRWRPSGILAGLAGATRLVGIFLLPALLWEWHENKIKDQRSPLCQGYEGQTKIKNTIKRRLRNSKSKGYLCLFLSPGRSLFSHLPGGRMDSWKVGADKILHFAFCILQSPILHLVPLGLIFYMIYLQLIFGDWLYFWHVQPVFGAERSGSGLILFPQVVFRYLRIILTIPADKYMFWVGLWELSFTLFAAITLLYAYLKKIRPSYLIFSILAVFTPTLTGTFSSMPRYILVAFPMFIALGLIKNKWVKIVLLSTYCLLLTAFILLFTSGRWVS